MYITICTISDKVDQASRASESESEIESEIIISLSPRGFSRLIYNSFWGTLARLHLRKQ